jgi:hypothetical protein
LFLAPGRKLFCNGFPPQSGHSLIPSRSLLAIYRIPLERDERDGALCYRQWHHLARSLACAEKSRVIGVEYVPTETRRRRFKTFDVTID